MRSCDLAIAYHLKCCTHKKHAVGKMQYIYLYDEYDTLCCIEKKKKKKKNFL